MVVVVGTIVFGTLNLSEDCSRLVRCPKPWYLKYNFNIVEIVFVISSYSSLFGRQMCNVFFLRGGFYVGEGSECSDQVVSRVIPGVQRDILWNLLKYRLGRKVYIRWWGGKIADSLYTGSVVARNILIWTGGSPSSGSSESQRKDGGLTLSMGDRDNRARVNRVRTEPNLDNVCS